jgi:hypothetical protein
MCTVIRKEQWGHPQIAEEDFVMYKQGIKEEKNPTTFKCRYQNFRYIPDRLYKTDITEAVDDRCVSDYDEDIYRDEIPKSERFYIELGFHSFATFERARVRFNSERELLSKAEFIVPKGAEYYKNGANNIVSNQIVFKKFINNEKETTRLDRKRDV